MLRFASALLLVSLAACGGETAPEGDPTGVSAPKEAPADNATLDLEADGIVVPAQGGAEQMDLPFGSTRAAVEATLETVLGAVQLRSENDECGAGPMDRTEFDGLTLNFQDDRLIGYYASAPYVPELSRAEMLADPAVTLVDDSTLGEEFTIGTGEAIISGLFTGEGDDALVEGLWAGTNCVFR